MARILVVDDDPDILSIISVTLKAMGHQVDEAVNGAQAVALAHSAHPDLIFMDLMMPEMDGYEATRELKAEQSTANIPVVALTAKAMRGDEEAARGAGMNGYITKPFRLSEVLETVERLLDSTPQRANDSC